MTQLSLKEVEDILLVTQIYDYIQGQIQDVLPISETLAQCTDSQIFSQVSLLNSGLEVCHGDFEEKFSQSTWLLLQEAKNVSVRPINHLKTELMALILEARFI
jgi:hypothetical protein